MDYMVGSVAALISGNVTPNRPKLVRKPFTPTKHQNSPNVTPKCDVEIDKSIFLSPTLQKKKAIIKKSPKRIFQNTDLDSNKDDDITSPKVTKVKKHLNQDLESDNTISIAPKSSTDVVVTVKPNKKSKKNSKLSKKTDLISTTISDTGDDEEKESKKNRKRVSLSDVSVSDKVLETVTQENKSKKIKKQSKANKQKSNEEIISNGSPTKEETLLKNKKTKKNAKSKLLTDKNLIENEEPSYINPNAVTDKDTDSEHESDDNIESDNEIENEKELATGDGSEKSSDDEEEEEEIKTKKSKPIKTAESEKPKTQAETLDEIKRTLFVGNVLYSKKTKKEIKKIFYKYGNISTIRIRNVVMKDPQGTFKKALNNCELHPDKTTVNVFVKFEKESSVAEALAENNFVLNGYHLQVNRSDKTGAEYDPKCAVFVGNIPFKMTDEELRERFTNCGEILAVRIVRDKSTGAGKGFGYVNFKSKDGVELALLVPEEQLTIKNRILRVKRCTQSARKQDSQQQTKSFNKPFKQSFSRNNNFQSGRNNYGQRDQQMGNGRQFSGNQNQTRFNNYNNQGPRGQQNFNTRQFPNNQNELTGFQRRVLHKQVKANKMNNSESKNFSNEKQDKTQNLKRKPEETSETSKEHKVKQPREKKQKQEFVGVTAEKKKKRTINKGDKKKKLLSEILAKK